jgi:hypothetical protein
MGGRRERAGRRQWWEPASMRNGTDATAHPERAAAPASALKAAPTSAALTSGARAALQGCACGSGRFRACCRGLEQRQRRRPLGTAVQHAACGRSRQQNQRHATGVDGGIGACLCFWALPLPASALSVRPQPQTFAEFHSVAQTISRPPSAHLLLEGWSSTTSFVGTLPKVQWSLSPPSCRVSKMAPPFITSSEYGMLWQRCGEVGVGGKGT